MHACAAPAGAAFLARPGGVFLRFAWSFARSVRPQTPGVLAPAYRKYCDRYEFIMRFSGSNWRRILRKNSYRLPNTCAG